MGDKDDVIKIWVTCSVGRLTDVVLQVNEKITYIGGGDTVNWVVEQVSSNGEDNRQSHILIKPLKAASETDFVIISDKRVYHLNAKVSETPTYLIVWKYDD